MRLSRYNMRYSKIVVFISVVLLLISTVSCEENSVSVPRIDKNSAINAMQDVLGLHEFDATDYDHYYIEDNYMRVYCSDLDNPGKTELNLTENLRAIDRIAPDNSFVHVSYFVFSTESEAEYYFHSKCCYIERTIAREGTTDDVFNYTEGVCGYFIKTDDYGYTAMYFVDDTVLTVNVADLENVELAQSYILALGLPID